jgi:hypothetical protein
MISREQKKILAFLSGGRRVAPGGTKVPVSRDLSLLPESLVSGQLALQAREARTKELARRHEASFGRDSQVASERLNQSYRINKRIKDKVPAARNLNKKYSEVLNAGAADEWGFSSPEDRERMIQRLQAKRRHAVLSAEEKRQLTSLKFGRD